MPKIIHNTEKVQARVSETTKCKLLKYKEKYKITEGEVIRRALKNLLHNTTVK
jgi:hypothetical protein